MLLGAFDLGVTHFDLANNYGPAPGAAEETLGRVLKNDLHAYRDELIISTKAGYDMWPGPYGSGGSRKYLISSLDQSLRRMGLDYVDIFYHHCPDPKTPMEETMGALADIVRQGKALYVGVSNYSALQTLEAERLLSEMGVRLTIHQPRYNMLDRWIEKGTPSLCTVLQDKGIGAAVFSPLAQGLLTNRYLDGIPADSRAARRLRVPFRKERHPRGCRQGPPPERACSGARRNHGAACPRLGAGKSRCHHRDHRREQAVPASAERRNHP